jgi:hypothetical protein
VKDELVGKVADEVVSLQRVWVEKVKEKRGRRFSTGDWRGMLEAKNRLVPCEKQLREVFDAYVVSANAGYEVVSSLTNYVCPEDEPWLEHYQTVAVFEVLYEFDREFRRASLEVAKAVDRAGDLIEKEAFARFSGRYGPTWIADYVATPGSFSNLMRRILDGVNIKTMYKWTFINAVSAARNTSYSVMFGSKFLDVLAETNDVRGAVEAEKERIKQMWLSPAETQVQIMRELGHKSFDYDKCLRMFRERIQETTVKAAEAGVHYANLSLIPTWAAGDFHHVSQTTYNLCKGDVEMAILESLTEAVEKTIEKAKKDGKLKSPYKIPTWEITAAGAAHIMRLDGFTSETVNDLLTRRFYNLLAADPGRFRYECMNDEFLNFLSQGERLIDKPPMGLGGRVHGVKIDLSPIDDNEVLKNPQRYSWPECPITARFSGLLKFADDPFHLYSDPMVCLYATELIALDSSKPYLPHLFCKQCASARLVPSKCRYCLAEKPIK